jgi:hypothetical protein
MSLISVSAPICLKVREAVEKQALFNLDKVSIRPLFPAGKRDITDGITFP